MTGSFLFLPKMQQILRLQFFFVINVRLGKSVLCNDTEVADVIRLIT